MHFWNSISTQMIDHEVGNLVSAIKQPINQKKNQGKVKKMRCSRSRMQAAGCRTNGTVAAGYCAIRNPLPISQCEFRNAKFTLRNFAMRISQCEFRNANFAMPISISQCQFQFRNANTLFICLSIKTLAKFRIAKFANPLRNSQTTLPNFANPFGIAKFTLRNLQALSSSVIKAEPPSIFGLLLFCPIT